MNIYIYNQVTMEVNSAILTRSEAFIVMEIATLKDIIDEHSGGTHINVMKEESTHAGSCIMH